MRSTIRGTISRLARIERKLGQRGEARFYIFGRDEEDLAERYAAEVHAGAIRHGDLCTTAIWRRSTDVPPARWLRPNEMTDNELSDTIHHLALACGRDPLREDADEHAVRAELSAIYETIRLQEALPLAP